MKLFTWRMQKGLAKRLFAGFGLVLLINAFGCRDGSIRTSTGENSQVGSAIKANVPTYSYEVIQVLPHDPEAFTQGLFYHEGKIFESTGQIGTSSLRRVEPETGRIEQEISIPSPYFAEGITLLNGKIYQLTWQDRKGFIYDVASFSKLGEFAYYGEGWGLTNDGNLLIMSDGTNRLRLISPDNFQVVRTITVVDDNRPIDSLNELEYVRGEIYANIWHDDRIARIDPETGKVVGWIDLTGLLSPSEQSDPEAVLNGIAFDAVNQRLFVTGKLWPKLFEIRVR